MSRQAKYLALFVHEAEEHLASLQQGLLQLEQRPDDGELLQQLQRNAHTVKGSARMLGLESIGTVAHRMEDLLKEISDGRTATVPAVVDLLLAASDMLGALVAAAARDDGASIDLSSLLESFARGALVAPSTPHPAAAPSHLGGAAAVEGVRVALTDLDRLGRYFGELELIRQRMATRIGSLKHPRSQECPYGERIDATLGRFVEDLQELDMLLQDVAAQNRKLRMLPLRSLMEGFGRLVRDLARSHGKEVRVTITGDELEIDRLVLDGLRPAFTHMLTNAIAHGIEAPDDRIAAGKPPYGELRIAAQLEGESFSISLRDDGKGMNPDLIRSVAVLRGILTPEQAAGLSDDESLYLTLRHGFTTQEEVGSIAGRGVGLDVVAEQIRKIKGSILITSQPGSFCEFSLLLPRSLMSMEGVVVACGTERYVIPAAHVAEILFLSPTDFTMLDGSLVYAAESAMPIISLADMFGLPPAPRAQRQPAIVLRHRERRLLCLIDALIGSQSVVVLKLSQQFVSVKFVIGATLLADGEPVLILNVQDLFAVIRGEYCPLLMSGGTQDASGQKPKHILVVDDSLTSRNLEATILRAQGYLVTTAENGAEALALVSRERFALVVCDCEMPVMDGLVFTARLREQFAADILPVVMVSSLGSDADLSRAFTAGVQAYMVKGNFDQDRFLAMIEQLTLGTVHDGAT